MNILSSIDRLPCLFSNKNMRGGIIMKKKTARTFMMCLFMVLLAMCGFIIGFGINERIHLNLDSKSSSGIQLRIVPNDADVKPKSGTFIDARMEVL